MPFGDHHISPAPLGNQADGVSDDQVHAPVMLQEVLQTIEAQDGDLIVDGTFGAGGYSKAILDAADCTVIAIDRDPDAIKRSRKIKNHYGDRFECLEGCFGSMEQLVQDTGVQQVDAIVLDIGVSSYQLDEAHRGFSFQKDGPLDMRMSSEGLSAADIVNDWDEGDIADILYLYGDERKSRQIASAILRERSAAPIMTTLRLADIIASVVKVKRVKGKKFTHPATRSFQALRIRVNEELDELTRALKAAERLLRPGGRLVVVTFHSAEDRIVKKFLAEKSGRIPSGSRHRPTTGTTIAPTFKVLKSSGLSPTKEEEALNPRARSARLRYGIRLGDGGVS